MPTDLQAIRSRHQPEKSGLVTMTSDGKRKPRLICADCGVWWPCDAARLAALLTEANAARALEHVCQTYTLTQCPSAPESGEHLHIHGKADENAAFLARWLLAALEAEPPKETER